MSDQAGQSKAARDLIGASAEAQENFTMEELEGAADDLKAEKVQSCMDAYAKAFDQFTTEFRKEYDGADISHADFMSIVSSVLLHRAATVVVKTTDEDVLDFKVAEAANYFNVCTAQVRKETAK